VTIVAYRDGVLASDSRVTINDFIDSDTCKKIYRLSDGSLLGLAGNHGTAFVLENLLREWVKSNKGRLPPGPFKKVEAIFVRPDKTVWVYGAGWEKWGYKTPVAIGNGMLVATGAMDTGATAKEAVKATIKRNIYCGGRVQVLKLKPKGK